MTAFRVMPTGCVCSTGLAYAKSKPGVWFGRKDEIAKWALEHRAITPVYDRGAPTVSGLPGSAV